jgi:glycerate 2-kinase
VVDGTTIERANSRQLAVSDHLNSFNAYPLFDQLGDAIVTGDTGNNLRDLRVLLAY